MCWEILRSLRASKLLKAIIEHPEESRREWMLEIFKKAGASNSRNMNYQFWQQDNQPKIIYTPDFEEGRNWNMFMIIR